MAEYWKKEDVLKVVNNLVIGTYDPNVEYAFCRLQEIVSKYLASMLPAADVVERKKGEWIPYEIHYDVYFKCSECGNGETQDQTNYCPSCGADMR